MEGALGASKRLGAAPAQGHRQLVGLPAVAQVERELDAPASVRMAGRGEQLAPLPLQRAEARAQVRRPRARDRLEPRLREVVDDVGEQQAQCRRHTGMRGNEHTADAELLGKRAAVHRAGSAERHERGAARIVTAPHGDDV